MSIRFQKTYYTILFSLFLACTPDSIYEPAVFDITPIDLVIDEPLGIKVVSNFITGEASMNVKLNSDEDFYLKIYDIENKVVAKEKVNGKIGDNIFKIYTQTLPKSSYRIVLERQSIEVGSTQINLL